MVGMSWANDRCFQGREERVRPPGTSEQPPLTIASAGDCGSGKTSALPLPAPWQGGGAGRDHCRPVRKRGRENRTFRYRRHDLDELRLVARRSRQVPLEDWRIVAGDDRRDRSHACLVFPENLEPGRPVALTFPDAAGPAVAPHGALTTPATALLLQSLRSRP
jgi:hypothetical protein